MLTLEDRVCANADILSTTVDDETMVLDIARGVYLNLNVMASDILRRLERETSLGALCGELAGEFDASPAQLKQEVLGFAAQLRDAGLIRVIG